MRQEDCASRKSQVGSEHLLIGLISHEGSVGARVLTDLGLQVEPVRQLVEESTGFGDYAGSRIETAPETEQIIQGAISEAQGKGHQHIGTEHLLLALMSQSGCTAVNLLAGQGITKVKVKAQTGQTLKEARTRRGVSESFEWDQHYVAVLIELSAKADSLNPQLEELAEMLAEPHRFDEIPEDVKKSIGEITGIVRDLREIVRRL